MRRPLLLLFVALVACGGPSQHTDSERGAIARAYASRGQENARLQAETCKRARALNPGVEELRGENGLFVSGSYNVALGCFVGMTRLYNDPFRQKSIRILERGVIVTHENLSVKGYEVYDGKFVFLTDEKLHKGTYIMVGTHTRRDGTQNVGIFVSEYSFIDTIMPWVPANKSYLVKIEKRHKVEVAQYRAEQAAKAKSKSGFSFAKALVIGAGAALIATSNIKPDQMVQLGAAYVTDVMTDGKAGAMNKLMSDQMEQQLENAKQEYEQNMERLAQERAHIAAVNEQRRGAGRVPGAPKAHQRAATPQGQSGKPIPKYGNIYGKNSKSAQSGKPIPKYGNIYGTNPTAVLSGGASTETGSKPPSKEPKARPLHRDYARLCKINARRDTDAGYFQFQAMHWHRFFKEWSETGKKPEPHDGSKPRGLLRSQAEEWGKRLIKDFPTTTGKRFFDEEFPRSYRNNLGMFDGCGGTQKGAAKCAKVYFDRASAYATAESRIGNVRRKIANWCYQMERKAGLTPTPR